MNKNKIIYWTSTGLVSAMMLMSAVMYFTMPEAKEGFAHAGFPDYFRIELGTAKLVRRNCTAFTVYTSQCKRMGLCRIR
jgi:hypothetical protein